MIKEVGDSFTWRRFCRIAIDEKMPAPSTLIYDRKRYGEDIEKELNEALVQKLKEKILSIAKVRRRRTRKSWEEADKITRSVIETTETVIN